MTFPAILWRNEATAGEQSLLAVCLFIKQWYGFQQANEQKYRRNRQSVVQTLVPAMFQLFFFLSYLPFKMFFVFGTLHLYICLASLFYTVILTLSTLYRLPKHLYASCHVYWCI